jgi:hypothetical protein
MGLAAAFAYWLTDDTPQRPTAPQTEPAPPPAASTAPEPKPPAVPVAQRQLPPAAPAPSPEPVAPLPAPAPAAADAGPAEAALRVLAEPKAREHAQLMVLESAKMALKSRDLMKLQRLRTTVRTGGIEQAIAPNDLTAMDIGIECLAQAADAKQRAFEFLEDNPGSPLAESLRIACP